MKNEKSSKGMTTLHNIELGEYKNANYIKPEFCLILISNPAPVFNFDHIHSSDIDKKFVLSTPLFLSKHCTLILMANKNENKDIKMPFLPDLSRPKQYTAKSIDYHKLVNP